MSKEEIDDIEYVRKNLMEGLKTLPTKDKVKTKIKAVYLYIKRNYGKNRKTKSTVNKRS